MRLTAMSDFALRLLMYVAQQPDRLCTIAEVARVYDISEAHLMKVTHQLGQMGFIETVRGKGGGLRLARPAAEIGVGAVVRAMEADFRLAECFGEDGRCVLAGACCLQTMLHGALAAFMQHLDQFSLADIALPQAIFDATEIAPPRPMRWGKGAAN